MAAAQAAEQAHGMSAATAKRQGSSASNRQSARAARAPQTEAPGEPVVPGPPPAPVSPPPVPPPAPVRPDLLGDGTVVKASYNTGCQERFVPVTAVASTGAGERQRFILGARPTVRDRHGEWGAAVSLLAALTPLPPHTHVRMRGDAGLCGEEFAAWWSTPSFGSRLRSKKNAGGIYARVADWAEWAQPERPEGDVYEPCRMAGAARDSRRRGRLPGRRFARLPGMTEGFVIEKRGLGNPRRPTSNTTSPVRRMRPGPAQKSSSGSSGLGIPRPVSSVGKMARVTKTPCGTHIWAERPRMWSCATPS